MSDRPRARWVWRVLSLLPLLALLQVDRILPSPVDQTPGKAEVTFSIGAFGDVSTAIETAEKTRERLLGLGRVVVGGAFPGRASTVEIDGNSWGAPIIEARTEDAYVPGVHPLVVIDSGEVRRALLRDAIAYVDVRVCPAWVWSTISPPRKVRTTGDCVRTNARAESISVEMNPRPDRLWRGVLLTAFSLAAAVVGIVFLRRRPAEIAIAAPIIGMLIVGLSIFWAPSNDEMNVAGRSMPFEAVMNGAGRAVALIANTTVLLLAASRRRPADGPPSGPTPPIPPPS